jgi:uncharacterized protein (DUF1015 family)
MATIRPFAALRPQPALAARICELPYDVMSSEEARALAAGNPLSFLRVSKPEIDLPAGMPPDAPEVYAKGSENFRRLIAERTLVRDPRPCLYLYRQTMGDHAQTGLVAAADCQEYIDGIIKKHELTRKDKEDDRVRHIEALGAQTGPVFLTYRARADIDEFVAARTALPAEIDFTAVDGIRHESWTIAADGDIGWLAAVFAQLPALYIADGHHRSAAAARVFAARGGAGHSGGFLAVVFPHDQLRILPYYRTLKDLNGLRAPELLERLAAVFAVTPGGPAEPPGKRRLGLYLDGRWHGLEFRPERTAGRDLVGGLDVALLQDLVLAPVFGIDDPRTSKRIDFVGGIRGTAELEKLVDRGEAACAFSMFPTSIEDLMAIADAGGIMPPKSTWFEPKLRDAMFCHLI